MTKSQRAKIRSYGEYAERAGLELDFDNRAFYLRDTWQGELFFEQGRVLEAVVRTDSLDEDLELLREKIIDYLRRSTQEAKHLPHK